MSAFLDSLVFILRRNGKRAADLLGNIPDEQMSAQPAGFKNHPAWSLSHLSFYHPAILALARGATPVDPNNAADATKHGNGSKPSTERGMYLSKADLSAFFAQGHAEIESALLARKDPDALLASDPGVARWRETYGTRGTVLMFLLAWHETHHLCEIADWKKLQGLAVL